MEAELPDDAASAKGTREWPHAPPHRLAQAGVYFLTARTRDKQRLFHDEERLSQLTHLLRSLATRYGWKLEAWCVLANHYHVVAHSPDGSGDALPEFINHLHAQSARELNKLDGKPGRRVWSNYRETLLTIQTSYLARLNYTHQNAVHHKLAAVASEYPWCSASEFEHACTPAWIKTVYSFKTDRLNVEDDFD